MKHQLSCSATYHTIKGHEDEQNGECKHETECTVKSIVSYRCDQKQHINQGAQNLLQSIHPFNTCLKLDIYITTLFFPKIN